MLRCKFKDLSVMDEFEDAQGNQLVKINSLYARVGGLPADIASEIPVDPEDDCFEPD